MFLLDTHVISELRKARADSNVQAWARSVPPASLFLCAVSLPELETGILRDPGPTVKNLAGQAGDPRLRRTSPANRYGGSPALRPTART